MITFANELSKHLKSHSIVSLAKETGIERTLLQKIVKGIRNPSKQDDVISLAKALMLSPANQSALLTAYKIDKIGLGVYNRRKLVKNFFEFPPLSNSTCLSNNSYNNLFSGIPTFNDDTLYISQHFGFEEVKKITKEVLEHSNKDPDNPIYLILPSIKPEFIETLKFILFSYPNLHIKHLVCMQQEVSMDNDNHYNLACFNLIFPLLFYGHDYEAYIYYGEPEVMNSFIMPNYLITGESVISYSCDYSSALFFSRTTKRTMCPENEPDLITFYRQEFINILRVSSPLFEPLSENMINYLNMTAILESNSILTYNISSIPCLGYFLTPFLAEKYINPEYSYKKELIISLEQRNNILKTKTFHANIFFTKDGLQKFVETGLISDCPEEIYIKPEEKDRLEILISFYDAIQAGIVVPYLIDTTQFQLSPLIKAGIYPTKIERLFLVFDLPQKGFQQFYLLESSISNSFSDFIKHLPESNYVFSVDAAKKCIQDAILQLKEFS